MAAAIERMRGVVALREYGQDARNPIVIYNLSSLEALFRKRGFEEEANALRQEALRRLESYVENIPVHSHEENHGLGGVSAGPRQRRPDISAGRVTGATLPFGPRYPISDGVTLNTTRARSIVDKFLIEQHFLSNAASPSLRLAGDSQAGLDP